MVDAKEIAKGFVLALELDVGLLTVADALLRSPSPDQDKFVRWLSAPGIFDFRKLNPHLRMSPDGTLGSGMHIFLSHSSRQKPLVREVKKHLPEHLSSWLDEEKLLFGDSIPASIERTIQSDTDYVLLFIDEYAAASTWVEKEVQWTLQAEKLHNRTILLPVVVDHAAYTKMASAEIKHRKYLRLDDFLEHSVRSLSDHISSELFALVCRDMHLLRSPKPKTALAAVADAENFLQAQARTIQKAVFPHRKSNPISAEKLLEVINSLGSHPLEADQFQTVLSSIIHRNLVPGLIFDGFEAYLLEEHARWKGEVEHEKKEKIGRKAASFIQDGMTIFLDAGSTIDELVKVMIKKIENRALSKISIVTTSVSIAGAISACCVRMGFDDNFSAVKLYVPGGQVRPGTQAIVSAPPGESHQIEQLAEFLGGFDLGVVGVNGVTAARGFTTHENPEALNKRDIIAASRLRLIVGDSSKIGLDLECKFADFEDDVKFLVDNDAANPELIGLLSAFSSKIILA